MTLSNAEMANVERLRNNLMAEINIFSSLVKKEQNGGSHGEMTRKTGATLPGWKWYDNHKAVLTRISRVAMDNKELFEGDVTLAAKVKMEGKEGESSLEYNPMGPVPNMAASAEFTMGRATGDGDASDMPGFLICVTEYAMSTAVDEVFRWVPAKTRPLCDIFI
jgi:hypothetical protein